jgi:hypothetical protein
MRRRAQSNNLDAWMTQQSRPQFVEHSPLAPAATAYPIRNVGFGSIASFRRGVNHFRSTLISRRFRIPSACLKGANIGNTGATLRRRQKQRNYSGVQSDRTRSVTNGCARDGGKRVAAFLAGRGAKYRRARASAENSTSQLLCRTDAMPPIT